MYVVEKNYVEQTHIFRPEINRTFPIQVECIKLELWRV